MDFNVKPATFTRIFKNLLTTKSTSMKSILSSLKINTFTLLLGLSIAASATLLPSCMAAYDAMGTENVSTISTKLPALMGKATEAYSKHEADVTMLSSDLDKAVSHAASMKKNKEVAESWRLLQNDLVAPFLARWKEKGKLDKDFIKEATTQVTKSLDAIKRAEMAKKK
jgi:hypothetical protein